MKAKALGIIDDVCRKATELGMASSTVATAVPAQAEFLRSCSPALIGAAKEMTGLVDTALEQHAAAARDLTGSGASTAAITVAAACVGLVVLGLLAVLALRASVSRPIRSLAAALQRLADGDLGSEVEDAGRRDEIGAMARAAAMLRSNGLKSRQMALEAAATRDTTDLLRARMAAVEVQTATEQASFIDQVAAGLARLSAGDFLFRIDRSFDGDPDKLRPAFNAAGETLGETMKRLSHNAAAIRAGSRDISTAADDLSRSTEQQAASLEETAATLDEITTNVRKTSEGAMEARSVVAGAKSGAEHASRIMRRAVTAMTAIETSARNIGQIIGVIDEIAFQTNLLALNAGVEASRAGDAGRGFAVVASEVRALAQRSAEAAKEIKTLISASSEQVADGVQLVHQSGKGLDRIAQQVDEMAGIVGEISASTQDQANALQEVGTAIDRIDRATQQTAALAEASTTAGLHLSLETEELARIVATFRFGQDLGHASASPRRPETKPARAPAPRATPRSLGRGGAAPKLASVRQNGSGPEL